MKKLFVFMLLMVGFVAMAQDTTSVTIDYVAGQPILDALKANMWPLILFAFLILEDWLGRTKVVDPNSTVGLIFSWVKGWLKKKK